MTFRTPFAALALLSASALCAPAFAQDAPPATVATPAATVAPPKLTVAISVDQFSADLFAEYRRHFTGGLARLQDGVVFPSGYQSHAATETCPGHSTILTGNRPEHTGIIVNNWIDQRVARADKVVYCVEDETVPGSSSTSYTVSPKHLRVPTLGDRMKAANPASRVVSVAGKDRAAVMMGGHVPDQIWWWDGKTFSSYAGATMPATVTRARAAVAAQLAHAQPALDEPSICAAHDRPIVAGALTVGSGRFARAAGDARGFRTSPEIDGATLAIAAGLVQEMKLGKGPAADLLAIGVSATDYVGHTYGTEGPEMCLQLLALDRSLGDFFAVLDKAGIDYQVVLTADHGGHDLPERQDIHAMPMEVRADGSTDPKVVSAAIGTALGLPGQLLYSGEAFGDFWIERTLTAKQKAAVLAEAVKRYAALPQVAAVFTHAQLRAAPDPKGQPENWTLLDRARASFDDERSGDFLILPRPRITSIVRPGTGAVATHGTPWDNDRRVPILFWRKGMAGFEQPASIETIDIMPTLAATIGLPLPATGYDGRCLDLDAGPATTCPN